MRFATDENFDNHLLQALIRRYSDLNIVRIQDTFLHGDEDDEVLQWCAQEERILLTHDVSTLIAFAYQRVGRSMPMPGVWEVSRTMAITDILNDLAVLIECGGQEDFQDRVIFIPLR
ncbi:MAG: DUF5615 family PIN-like protein [Pirellulales bacterium]